MSPPAPKTSKANVAQINLIRDLGAVMEELGLVELEFSDDTAAVRLSKAASVAAPTAPPATPPLTSSEAASPQSDGEATNAMTSPMVGTAYLKPEPEAPVFVNEGDNVKVGQTLLIIEAMKVMNPIAATKSGVVRKILVDNEQPVEFGQPLMIIE